MCGRWSDLLDAYGMMLASVEERFMNPLCHPDGGEAGGGLLLCDSTRSNCFNADLSDYTDSQDAVVSPRRHPQALD